MSCRNYQDRILELFGTDQLPEDIQEHVKSCSECSEFLNSLKDIENTISDEAIFFPDKADTDRIITRVESMIDSREIKKVTSISPIWKTFIPAAAAVLLIVGLGSVTHLIRFGDEGNSADTSNVASIVSNTNDNENYDADAYSDILQGYISENDLVSTDVIFDNMTDDEMKYLEQNFDVGDIL